MEQLVQNLLLAFKQSINTLDWMSPATKKEAQAKLAKSGVKKPRSAIKRIKKVGVLVSNQHALNTLRLL